jgi:hypothetical protein
MNQNGYILGLYEMRNKLTDPGEAAKQLLSLIIGKSLFSTYQCYKELNKHKKISYKNVHKRVKKLYELGLLKEVNNTPGKHGSIYYKLSFFGIYFIFLNHKIDSFNIAKIIENYPDDGLFQYFLFRFIDKKTLHKINSQIILEDIFSFLKNCCLCIEDYLKNLAKLEIYRNDIEEFLDNLSKKEKYRNSCITIIDHFVNFYLYFDYEIDKCGSNFCMGILNYAEVEGELEKLDKDIIHSLKMLSKDKRFKNTLEQIKNKVANNFYKFEAWSLS